ncbi:MAG: MFS transporter, partial [Candidatus Hydrothermarchaeota archaeon]
MSSSNRGCILLGIACLLTSAFYDNIRGPLLPLFADRYGLDYSKTSAFLTAGSLSSFLYALLSVRLLSRWSERAYLRAALLIQAGAVLGTAFGEGYPMLLLCGLLWGFGNTGIGLSSNLLTIRGSDEGNRSRLLNGLHVFYGLGSTLPALYISFALGRHWPLPAMLGATLLLLPALGVFSRTADLAGPAKAEGPGGGWNMLLSRCALLSNLCLSTYVLGEVLTSMWLFTYLHDHSGLDVSQASRLLQAFFLCLAAGRFLSALFVRPSMESWLQPACILGGMALLLSGLWGWEPGFALSALAMGPFYPLMLSSIVRDFPSDYPRLISFANAVMTVALAVGHLAIGMI